MSQTFFNHNFFSNVTTKGNLQKAIGRCNIFNCDTTIFLCQELYKLYYTLEQKTALERNTKVKWFMLGFLLALW